MIRSLARAAFAAGLFIAADARAVCTTHWDVVANVTSGTDWGSIQFDLEYEAATGRFSGSNSDVRCTNRSSALYARSDLDSSSPKILRQGWVAFSSQPAPGPLSRCTFLSNAANVTPADFDLTVTAHSNTSGGSIPVTIAISVTCSLCGNGVVDAGESCDPRVAGQECCNPDTCAAIVSNCNLCGNGIVNSGEQCDDYETVSGDCCSTTCRYDGSGAACGSSSSGPCDLADTCNGAGLCRTNTLADGMNCTPDLCHDDGQCASGVCSGGAPRCDDASPCTRNDCNVANGACSFPVAPSGGCRTSDSSSLLLSTAHDGKALWKWDRGEATECGEFDAPDLVTDFDVCIFDSLGGGEYTLASHFSLPATPAWQIHGDGDDCSWLYKDKTFATDGIKRFAMESGTNGRASMTLSAIGPETPVPAPLGEEQFLHATSGVVVQAFNGTGTCWESSFDEALKNDGKKFRAARKVRE